MKKQNRMIDSGFDLIAPIYDPLSRLVFGNTLRNAQTYWLSLIPQQADILVFGGGSGWLLSRILSVCNPRKVIYIDASPAMIALARQKASYATCVEFRVGTETSIRINDQVDAVITPFILDLFTNQRLQTLILPALYQTLRDNGLWLSTDFVTPVRWWHRFLLWAQYRFFRSISQIEAERLPDWIASLANLERLKQVEIKLFFGGMIGSGYWQKQENN